MENIDIFKIYCFLFFIVILLLWKFWKDFEFKNKYFAQIEKSNENQNIILKELEALSIEITDNAKKIDNLTSYLNIQNHIDKNSAFNTPPTFSIYVMLKMLNWIESNGGLKELESRNISKAKKIYSFLEDKESKLTLLAPKLWRSNANIVFDFKGKNLTELFLQESIENGFIGLNGHRSVGGVRVSNYNSVTEEMVSDFLLFLEKFISSN